MYINLAKDLDPSSAVRTWRWTLHAADGRAIAYATGFSSRAAARRAAPARSIPIFTAPAVACPA
ncbi:DUF1508 domain-containing protein [Sphingomonas sp. IW22]